jgi:4-hydroxybenzoate polyprenyltransferase
MTAEPAPHLSRRFWRYQQERFGLIGQGGLAAVFGLAACFYGAALDPRGGLTPNLSEAMVALLVTTILFFQLLTLEEHRDYHSDLAHHPRRAVARGLVSLAELRALCWWGAALQALLLLLLHPPLLALLIAAWIWIALIGVDFFYPEELARAPLLRLALRMGVAPWFALLGAGCGLFPKGGDFTPALATFMVMAFTNALILELARHTLAAPEERIGVDSYSKLWGQQRSGLTLAGAIALGLFATMGAYLGSGAPAAISTGAGGQSVPVVILAPAILASFIAFMFAAAFAEKPTLKRSRAMFKAAGASVLVNYLCVGILPALR